MTIFIIFTGIGIILLLSCISALQFAKLPEHVKNNDKQLQYITAESFGERVTSAIDEEKKTVFDGEGLDLPFSSGLLDVLNRHWNTELEEKSAGFYYGKIDDMQTLELLLNPEGRVGQIQVNVKAEAGKVIFLEALKKYACFVNTSLSEEQADDAAGKAYTEIQQMELGKERIFFDGMVGFGLRKEKQTVYIYVP